MYTIEDYIAFVKKQIEYQDRRAVMTRADSKKNPFHVETAKQFRVMLEFLESLSNAPAATKQIKSDINPISPLLPKELVGLPQELIAELSAKGTDQQELLIIELIEAAGGTLSLDRILIGIYNKSAVIMKRPAATAKLYRMIQKEMIYTVPKKKGIYTTTNPETTGLSNNFTDTTIDWTEDEKL